MQNENKALTAEEEINELKKEVEILRDYKEILESEIRLEKQNSANLLEAFKICYGTLRITTGITNLGYDSIIAACEGKNTERRQR